jgi:hypothetical protein
MKSGADAFEDRTLGSIPSPTKQADILTDERGNHAR